jgi:hypothetical protein
MHALQAEQRAWIILTRRMISAAVRIPVARQVLRKPGAYLFNMYLLNIMKQNRVTAEKKRLVTATRRVTRAKKMLTKANKALAATRKRIVNATRAQKKATKQ